jgi:hypothetical protein
LTRKKKINFFLYEFISIWTEEERDEFGLDVDGMREDRLHEKKEEEKKKKNDTYTY